MTRLDRREVLAGGLCGLGASFLRGPLGGRAQPNRTLVLVQLSGGNDGLNTVVPYEDDDYHRARPKLALDPADVLPIEPGRGLHPSLTGLRALYGEGRVAIVEGAGYPEPNRSHFQSFEIWHTADTRGRAAGDGWIGRLCQAAWPDVTDPALLVHVGARVPWSLHSTTHPAASFVAPGSYRWAGSEAETAAYDEAGQAPAKGDASARLTALRGVLRDAQASSRRIRAAAARYRPSVEYPDNATAWALRDVAALVTAEIGTRVFSIELGSFDTHRDQLRRHADLLSELDGGLAAFQSDLAGTAAGRETLVLVFSEFGRRVAENASKGTDHGTAGPMFLLGERVQGGLWGRHPSLTELDQDDLVHTTDFRSVYATVLADGFGADAERVLAGRYPGLPLLG